MTTDGENVMSITGPERNASKPCSQADLVKKSPS